MESSKFQQLATNFAILTGGEILSKICTFAAFAFLARVLGPINFGNLEFTLAIMVFLNLLVYCGSGPYGAREIAKNKDHLDSLLTNVISLRLLLSIIGYLLLVAFTLLHLIDKQVQHVILIYGLTLFGIPGFLEWVFQGFEKMQWVALGSLIRQSIFTLGVFLVIRHADQLWTVAVVECVAVGGFVFYNLSIFRSQIKRFSPQLHLRSLREVFIQASPIGLSQLLWASSWYSATVILGLFVEEKAVGWFGASHRVVMALHTFVGLYFDNLLPSIARCVGQHQESLQGLMAKSLMITSWFAVFIGILGTIFSDSLLLMIYGVEYRQTALLLKLLIFVVVIALLSSHYVYVLIAFNHQRWLFTCYAASAVLSILLNFFLIPLYGAQGAATAMLLAALLNWALAYIFVRQNVACIPCSLHLIRPVIAGGIATLGFLVLPPWHLLISGVVVTTLYSFVLSVLQPGMLTDIRMLVAKNR